jgi:conjugal transfer pilus assembly protein TrbC
MGRGQGTVTEGDLSRARRSTPVITDADIERARQRNQMPSDDELSRVPIPGTPNIDALPQPASKRPVDLGALARGYENAMGAGEPAPAFGAGPTLLIFVSLSMPEASLARLVDQAARAKAVLVIRGFVNGSLKETVARAQRLIGQRHVGFQIDPQAFDRFAVEATPTFVLMRAGAQLAPCAAGTCFTSDAFASATGDVSIDYALEFLERSAPAFAKDAAAFLRRIKEAS